MAKKLKFPRVSVPKPTRPFKVKKNVLDRKQKHKKRDVA